MRAQDYIFDEDDALSKFDKLLGAEIIHHGPSRASSTYVPDDGFSFQFDLNPSWASKPRLPSSQPVPQDEDEEKPEFFGPLSDIRKSHADQVLISTSTHILALDMHPLSRPSYLLLSADSSRRQDEPLDFEDIYSAWHLFCRLRNPDDYYIMYNCAPEAGCSRQHKHIQILRRPSAEGGGFRFFPDVDDFSEVDDSSDADDDDGDKCKVPYRYFLHRFPLPETVSEVAVDSFYRECVAACRRQLGVGENDTCPHNLILTSDWLLVIPRRKPEDPAYMPLLPNGAGMMGMVSLADREIRDKWMSAGPAKVLAAFGLPPGPPWHSIVESENARVRGCKSLWQWLEKVDDSETKCGRYPPRLDRV